MKLRHKKLRFSRQNVENPTVLYHNTVPHGNMINLLCKPDKRITVR